MQDKNNLIITLLDDDIELVCIEEDIDISLTLVDTDILDYEYSSGKHPTIPQYVGEYTIIPDFEKQQLETKNKMLKDNVVVEEIPHYMVSNSTGNTFVIGKGDLII